MPLTHDVKMQQRAIVCYETPYGMDDVIVYAQDLAHSNDFSSTIMATWHNTDWIAHNLVMSLIHINDSMPSR